MSDKIREFFLGRVVFNGGGTFFLRLMEISLAGLILVGLLTQLS